MTSAEDASPDYVDKLNNQNSAGGKHVGANRFQRFSNNISNFSGAHKKGLIGGGIVMMLSIALVSGWLALLNLKLEAIMQNEFDKHVGNKIEREVEARTEAITEGYIVDGGDAAKPWVATGNPVTDLYRTFQVRNSRLT